MLRMILTKHIELNKAADQKANMLMTAASIIMAILISTGIAGLGFGHIFLLFTLVMTIVFSILVIFPKPYHNRKDEPINFLYFRSFRTLTEDEYVSDFMELMLDKEAMYEQYMRDIYRYGNVTLSKKYTLLRYAMLFFMSGLSVSGVYLLIDYFL